MIDAKRLLFGLLRSGMSGSRPHRAQQGFARSTTSRLGGGLLGTLATTALQSFMQRQDASASHAAEAPAEPSSTGDDDTAYTLIHAMIAAAKADGGIDYEERQRILTQLAKAGASDEERAFIEREMAAPLDLHALVSQVQGSDMAEEVYAASLLAIEIDTPAEQRYLQDLATQLRLDDKTVAEIHDRFDAPRPR